MAFKEQNNMVSVATLMNYSDWKIPFTVNTNASDKKLGGFIIKTKNLLIYSVEY